jgi:hypothetical protein
MTDITNLCHLCNVGLGTEFHFLFECTSGDVQRLRCKFIPIYYTRYTNMYKMKGLISLCNVKVLKNKYFSKLNSFLNLPYNSPLEEFSIWLNQF